MEYIYKYVCVCFTYIIGNTVLVILHDSANLLNIPISDHVLVKSLCCDSLWVPTLVGLPEDVDDLSGLQCELICLLGDVLLYTLHLRTVCDTQQNNTKNTVYEYKKCKSFESKTEMTEVVVLSPQSS